MIPSIPMSAPRQRLYKLYVLAFLIFLVLPLAVVVGFSFNDSLFPALPWQGFTLDWYFGTQSPKLGLFHDKILLESIGNSAFIALWVTVVALALALCNALLFVRYQFRGKDFLYVLMLLPLVIPGVILGVSILVSSSQFANYIEEAFAYDIEWLRPGATLIVLGQVAFITTICSLVLIARLRKFDPSLEEAALNLGASPWVAFLTVTVPFLRTTIVSAGIVSFLMSFENFNTTLMLVGSDAPLTIAMFQRLREGSTPVLNSVSVMLMLVSALLAVISVTFQKKEKA
ncbi:ABC transporter permease [Alginatibacterium sediminis]|uniref:ABC transporter permease n=1 Tax=Alginatibacterium sediminis TaxID=2164068 RepID=A0A420E804_9ALTE|nr:ABC transporter permease [Alginatibacterium sediminis]RKF15606.1 ABC transporter permease [Alginatibacterium sediminis]